MNTSTLAEKITRSSSYQTVQTIKLLVDKPLQNDCYKAYAYFRWADNEVDEQLTSKSQRIEFIKRQHKIIEDSYKHKTLDGLRSEEKIVYQLIRNDKGVNPKLKSFIVNFFKIIEFDAYRKGKLISQKELEWYTQTLAKAVTDCIYYFIGNEYEYEDSKMQYYAASAACIIHMLRDLRADVPEGYINIPKEYLLEHGLGPMDHDKPAFKDWVKYQSDRAQRLLFEGKQYISSLEILRCKIAALWYCERFEMVLKLIEKDGYVLRQSYPRKRSISLLARFLKISGEVVINHYL